MPETTQIRQVRPVFLGQRKFGMTLDARGSWASVHNMERRFRCVECEPHFKGGCKMLDTPPVIPTFTSPELLKTLAGLGFVPFDMV